MKKAMRLIALLLLVAVVAIPVYAAVAGENFTPSVSQKGAPRMMRFRNPVTGTEHNGVIVDENGEITAYVDGIEIVPLADVDDPATTDHEKMMLQWAFDSLNGKDLAEVIEGLAEFLKENGLDLTPADLVVYELFHITLDEETEALLAQGGKLVVKLEQKNMNIDFEMVIHATDVDSEWVAEEDKTESRIWEILPLEALEYGEENERIVTIEEGCIYALLTDKKD